ncbi:VIT1/CCC1 transporter family protein [Candidatus Pacearchaeota archaeon]|nr:VIT1/CCC1 transporter family protein [Candidatus Pacearchaeota archaeon]
MIPMIIKRSFEKKYLEEFVYGAIDGTVTTFAVVAGVMGASLSSVIVLILGFANLFADAFSMAISNYLAIKSENDLMAKHKHRHEHIKNPRKTAIATFFSFVIIGFIPLISFVLAVFIPSLRANQFSYSIALTALAFIIIGIAKARVTERNIFKSVFEIILIGGAAAIIAFVVGFFLRNLIGNA